MEIKNLHTIPEAKQARYLEKLEKRVQGQSEFKLRVIDGKTTREDLTAFLGVVRRSKTYQKYSDNYQFRLQSDDQGNQYLTLKQQGLWSRFKGFFRIESERRGHERATAIRQINDIMGSTSEATRARSERSNSPQNLLRDTSVDDIATQNGSRRPSTSYQDALQFHRNLIDDIKNAELLDAYNTIKNEIEKLYGDRGIKAFNTALENPDDPDALTITHEGIKHAIAATDRQMTSLLKQMQDIPQRNEAYVREDIKANWIAAESFLYDAPPGFDREYQNTFPQQVLKDLLRSNVDVDKSGALVIRGGTAFGTGYALNNRCEKILTFFEKGTGVSRTHSEFNNMFHNFIRNFHQGGLITLAAEVGLHQKSVGLGLQEFNVSGANYKSAVSIRIQGDSVTWDLSMDSNATFLSDRIPLVASLRDHVELPLSALSKPEKEFDIAKEIFAPSRTISLKEKVSEQPSEYLKGIQKEFVSAWRSANADGVIDSDVQDGLVYQYPVNGTFHKDYILRGSSSFENGTLTFGRRDMGGPQDKIEIYESALRRLFPEGTDDQVVLISKNLTGFLTQASLAEPLAAFLEVAEQKYEQVGRKDGWTLLGPHEAQPRFTLTLSEDKSSILINRAFEADGFVLSVNDSDHPDFGEKQVVKMPYRDVVSFSISITELVQEQFDPETIDAASFERRFLTR